MKTIHIKKYFVFIIFFICTGSLKLYADEKKQDYNVENIPPILLFDVNAVVRNYSITVTVENIEEAHVKYVYAVTILNKKGQNYGLLYRPYDKFEEISEFEGRLFDNRGNIIRDMDDDDVKDYPIISWATLFSDNRYKSAELYHNEFPYTVEFEYEVDYNGYINWPAWFPEEEEASVEYSSYKIITPSEIDFRYRCFNFDQNPVITPVDDNVLYSWEVSKLPKFKKELYGPAWRNQCISVVAVPNKFKIDDYEGDLSSWNEYSKWNASLWSERQKLPAGICEEVHSVIDGVVDKKRQIEKIYKYMQSKTRYADINYGIGGWQPVEAEKVYESGYGDCKALTNFMISLLNCAGIKAYPVAIYNDGVPNKIEKSFPCNQFNHVLAFVPLEKDTVWLECTSQTFPFNHIGSGNENRYALLISKEVGELLKTPASSSIQNKQLIKANVVLKTEGEGTADISTCYSGNKQDEISYVVEDLSSDSFEDWLKDELDIPSFSIKKKSFSKSENDNLSCTLNTNLILPNYASVMGSRLFFNPLLIRRQISVPEEKKDRKFPVIFSYPYSEIDTVCYKIPSEYKVETIPDSVKQESEYFRYCSQIKIIDNETLLFVRSFEIKSAEMPSDKYELLRSFLLTVINSDLRKVVLVKK
jgi:transglutaminase-like putative cysteine protease